MLEPVTMTKMQCGNVAFTILGRNDLKLRCVESTSQQSAHRQAPCRCFLFGLSASQPTLFDESKAPVGAYQAGTLEWTK
jgi:hypothetical protein